MTELNIARFLHLFSLVVWQGSLIFFTFFAAPQIFKALSRENAGLVVGRIFPRYWAMGYLTSALCLISLLYISYTVNVYPKERLILLGVMTIITFYSGLSVGKKARAIKTAMRMAEPGEGRKALEKSFKKIHAISAILNLIVFVIGVFLVYYTSLGLTP
ncbi:MAG: DUF4149 domain-containing protein [Thermodesulfobacteriota bacterium]